MRIDLLLGQMDTYIGKTAGSMVLKSFDCIVTLLLFEGVPRIVTDQAN